MTNEINIAKTPAGARLGDRIMINGRPGLRYKSGHTVDRLTPEQVVECITGCKVLEIVYEDASDPKIGEASRKN